jgi:hypothetical protein
MIDKIHDSFLRYCMCRRDIVHLAIPSVNGSLDLFLSLGSDTVNYISTHHNLGLVFATEVYGSC